MTLQLHAWHKHNDGHDMHLNMHTLRDIFLVLIKGLFILNCRHFSPFRDSSVQSEVSKISIQIERI